MTSIKANKANHPAENRHSSNNINTEIVTAKKMITDTRMSRAVLNREVVRVGGKSSLSSLLWARSLKCFSISSDLKERVNLLRGLWTK